MVIIDPFTGYDITPPTTGFYSIDASGHLFSLRSFPCGTGVFKTVSTGSYLNIPYYIGAGECIQLYNPANLSVDVSCVLSSDSPATTFFSVTVSLWMVFLFFSYILILLCMFGSTRYLKLNWERLKTMWSGPREVTVDTGTSLPEYVRPPEYIQQSSAPMYHVSL